MRILISKRFKVIIIVVIVAISIPALLMMYKNFQIMPKPKFDESHFSPLCIFHFWIKSQAGLTKISPESCRT